MAFYKQPWGGGGGFIGFNTMRKYQIFCIFVASSSSCVLPFMEGGCDQCMDFGHMVCIHIIFCHLSSFSENMSMRIHMRACVCACPCMCAF